MMTASAVVSLVAVLGWIALNWRAMQSHELSFKRKMQFAAAWVIIIAGLALVLGRVA